LIKDLKDQKCFLGFPAHQEGILVLISENGKYLKFEFGDEREQYFIQKDTELLF
jgi:hypothetical protein